MESRQAEVFLAVVEELHFGRAAARLNMTQPPVTKTIKNLEREFETELFVRSTRQVSLTAAGLALIGPARRLLDAELDGHRAVRDALGGKIGEVRVGFAGASTYSMISRLARRVRREQPRVGLVLESQNFAQVLMRRIVRGEIDIGMGRWDYMPASISSQVIATESLVIALPVSHPLAGENKVRICQFAHEPFVALRPFQGSVLTDRLERLGRSEGFVPDIAQVAPDTWTVLALVAAEIGPALTLSSVAENVSDPHVAFVPLVDETPPVQLRMAWRRDEPVKPVVARVLNIASDEFAT
ncbi:LysR substrate-binding domain-containing protein [Brevibacterium sp. UCMA 11754]|uniref:LysR substrate-binding domain-containing protein n=1 Tax=Brevibacterium sp. UCMA 11754 TaxID=2749198 RepID=UPI001F22291E|nr:LysR substrate-binding domain-containing protein [Brevibacterium sp. UCMA 11754]MCF2571139.1 LysR family transcriptional regulator [Brevibacterium sp. UCMA 11754]